ncbi:MAG: hypothetical protein ACOCY1_05655 [Halovenus sp.]
MERPPYEYEVAFDVSGGRREDYDEWRRTGALQWLAHEDVAEFAVYHNDQGLSPSVKFVFAFESLRAWASFVVSDEHEAAVDSLRTLTEQLDGMLWQRGGLSLDESADSVSDRPSEQTDRVRYQI